MVKLNILGIAGSPRKGNSDYLLAQALEAARQYAPERISVDTYTFRGKHIEPCLACGYCIRNQGTCIHKDDFDDLRRRWEWADAIVYSLPVYHMSMPGQVKCFIDRLGNASFGAHAVTTADNRATLAKQMKAVGTLAQGIHLFSGQEHTITDMINHALVMQSVPVAGDVWEAYIGAGGWTCLREDRNAIEQLVSEGDLSAQAAVSASRSVGRRCVEQADIILSGLIACRPLLAQDPIYHELFDRIDTREKEEA